MWPRAGRPGCWGSSSLHTESLEHRQSWDAPVGSGRPGGRKSGKKCPPCLLGVRDRNEGGNPGVETPGCGQGQEARGSLTARSARSVTQQCPHSPARKTEAREVMGQPTFTWPASSGPGSCTWIHLFSGAPGVWAGGSRPSHQRFFLGPFISSQSGRRWAFHPLGLF